MTARRRRRIRSLPALLTLAVVGFGTSGCFTTANDFRTDAEKFIVDDADLAEALSNDERSIDFVEATCEEPADKNVGTTFTCNAKDDVDADWEFQVEIQESNNYGITVSRFPPT